MAAAASETRFTAEPGKNFMTMERIFNAPPALVFEAHVKPEHVRNWYGFRDSEVTVCEIDLRVGGSWRYVVRGADGNEFAFNGVFKEIDEPNRLSYTWLCEGYPPESLETAVFEDLGDGRTRLFATSTYPSVEIRDEAVAQGMEEGAVESWDRLSEVVERLAAAAK